MVHSIFGKDRKRLLGPDPPRLLADSPANNVGKAGGDGHGARVVVRHQLKTQLWPCTASPAICGWHLHVLLPSCLGSVRDQTRFARGKEGGRLSLALLHHLWSVQW